MKGPAFNKKEVKFINAKLNALECFICDMLLVEMMVSNPNCPLLSLFNNPQTNTINFRLTPDLVNVITEAVNPFVVAVHTDIKRDNGANGLHAIITDCLTVCVNAQKAERAGEPLSVDTQQIKVLQRMTKQVATVIIPNIKAYLKSGRLTKKP